MAHKSGLGARPGFAGIFELEDTFDPSASVGGQVDVSGTAGGPYGGRPSWEGVGFNSPVEGTINQPGYMPDVFSQGTQGNYALGLNPSVNTGNQFSPTTGVNPFNPNPYDIDNITQPRTDFFANPTSGWENFAPTTGVNPFNTNPYNIDNITQPTFNLGQYNSGFPNQLGVYAYPGNLGYSVNPSAPLYALPGSVNTGNELGSVYNSGAGGVMGDWQSSPNMFNMNPYVETFNTGFPMNPAYNIDNITQPSMAGFGGYPNPFGSMFGFTGGFSYPGRGDQ